MRLIIFTTCKPMIGEDKWRQEQAIKSWIQLKDIEIKVIVFGNDKGVDELCEKYNLTHIPVVDNLAGVPRVKAMFETSASFAKPEDYMMWTNADIIFFQNLVDNIKMFDVHRKSKNIVNFALVGARLDWNNPCILPQITKEHFFGNIKINKMIGNQRLTKTIVKSDKYECHPITDDAIDYIIHSPTTYKDKIHQCLVIAGCYHDSILMWLATQSNYLTLNMSQTITAIHQNHGITEQSRNREKNTLQVNNGNYLGWLSNEIKKQKLYYDPVVGSCCSSALNFSYLDKSQNIQFGKNSNIPKMLHTRIMNRDNWSKTDLSWANNYKSIS